MKWKRKKRRKNCTKQTDERKVNRQLKNKKQNQVLFERRKYDDKNVIEL